MLEIYYTKLNAGWNNSSDGYATVLTLSESLFIGSLTGNVDI